MASVKVAVRVRPMNKREIDMESKFIIGMQGKKTSITNVKIPELGSGDQSRERTRDFTYDYSYWTVNKKDPSFAPQDLVFQDLGVDVIKSAYQGYNACVFAYGQTGSGKTYSMMGNPGDAGLIPRICEGLFAKMVDGSMTYRTEVSYLEIYNEKVRDLLKSNSSKSQHSLRVREHPKEGPYVQDLSKHIVQNFEDIRELMDKGNDIRTTASTNMNDVSSRSHAIFTIVFTQAKFSNDFPSETRSKIHLVDLAGSERADATGATAVRLKEGGSINKSLVTLGNVISALADMSDKGGPRKASYFIPYRDSVLTWLLKDSLGGNAKTMMIATISPADCNYAETLSTLRYANRAKNIINKPTVNEDNNVKLIRELRDEIARLKTMLGGNIDKLTTPRVQEKLHENEARVKVLTEEWAGKWKEAANILKDDITLALRKEGLGVVLDSELPHLIGIDDDILSTGIMLYHLKQGTTRIGTAEAKDNLDIVLQGQDMETEHCVIKHKDGEVSLTPIHDSLCMVNGSQIYETTALAQGSVILLGKTNMFRFNHPQQVQKLREEYKGATISLSASRMSLLSQSMTDLCKSTESLALATSGWEMEQKHLEQLEALEQKRRDIEDMEEKFRQAEMTRLAEQNAKETELEERKIKLESIQHKAEQTKQEAEEAQIQAKAEAAKLQRRSLDIDRQIQEYQEEKKRFHVEREQEIASRLERRSETSPGNKSRPKNSDMEKLIKEEMAELLAKERDHIEIAQGTKERLLQELEKVQRAHEEQKDHFHDSFESLKLREAACERTLISADDVVLQNQLLECDIERELSEIGAEIQHLEVIKDDYTFFKSDISPLDSSTKEILAAKWQQINMAQNDLSVKERQYFECYQEGKREALDKKDLELKDTKDKLEQLDADRVYIQDCEQSCLNESSKIDSMTTSEQEQLTREMVAIEIEKDRIEEEDRELRHREMLISSNFESIMQDLEIKRSGDIETLNKERCVLKELKSDWIKLVSIEARKKETEKLATLEKYEEGDTTNNESKTLYDTDVLLIEAEKQKITEDRNALELEQKSQSNEARKAISRIKGLSFELDTKTKVEIDKISSRMKALVELEAWESTRPTEFSIKQREEAFERYKILKDEKSFDELVKTIEQDIEDNNIIHTASQGGKSRVLDTEKERLQERLKDLHMLEDLLNKGESELQLKRQEFEEQRQNELDRIEMEKIKLQEMEHEERINALVEQEVKRRLLEERVQREKNVRIEREKDRLEREQEMLKLKKAHQKEIKRIKQIYESREIDRSAVGNVHVSTRANPYASVMSGDGVPSGRDHQPVMRARSTPLLSSVNNNPLSVSIPSYMIRGSGFDTHVEFEVKLSVHGETWTVFRRYTKFRELHVELKNKFPEVSALVFPPKKWFGNKSDRVIYERRLQLESYLCGALEALFRRENSPLHPGNVQYYCKQLLTDFHPFFKKGMFENSKYATS